MSSLSQEDLDARRERADAAATAAQAAVPSNAESVPPESNTVKKTEGPLESLVVPAGSQTSTPQIESQAEPRPFAFESLAPAPRTPAADSKLGTAEPADVAPGRIMQRVDVRVWLNEHRRAVCIAAAILGFVVAFFGFRGNNQGSRVEVLPLSKGQPHETRVAPIASVSQATEEVLLAPVVISEPAPARQRESFSDAFVKHAASVNSNWAEVKKRAKPTDVQSTNRLGAHAVTASSENPLNVLDQLEKARKAKKQAPSTP